MQPICSDPILLRHPGRGVELVQVILDLLHVRRLASIQFGLALLCRVIPELMHEHLPILGPAVSQSISLLPMRLLYDPTLCPNLRDLLPKMFAGGRNNPTLIPLCSGDFLTNLLHFTTMFCKLPPPLLSFSANFFGYLMLTIFHHPSLVVGPGKIFSSGDSGGWSQRRIKLIVRGMIHHHQGEEHTSASGKASRQALHRVP
mmetsp:Transcript_15363/g.36881  ORF Transcript_15363/g.36881 Transcript_15363/m.36881 type:complete len:201 (+) Transcript_15363:641-1243(+)